MHRYYYNNYESEDIADWKNQEALYWQLREHYPNLITHRDGIQNDTPVGIIGLPLFAAIPIDLKPKKVKHKKVKTNAESKKRGRPIDYAAKITKKQQYLTWIETTYQNSDSMRYRQYLIEEWERTKKQMEEITKNNADTH